MSLPRRVSIRMTEWEYQRWVKVASGAPLASWARVIVNLHVHEALRSFGEEAEPVVAAAPAAQAPSPEEQEFDLSEVIEQLPALTEQDIPLTIPGCSQASLHWTISRGDSCPECGWKAA